MDRLLKFNGRWDDDRSREVYLEVLVSSITGISSIHLSDRSYDRYIHFGKSKVLVPETPWCRVVAVWHDYQRWRESQASTPPAPEPRMHLATCAKCTVRQDMATNLDEAHRRITSLVGERDALQTSNDSALKRIRDLSERNDQQSQELAEADRRSKNLLGELSVFQGKVRELTKLAESRDRTIAAYQVDLGRASMALSELRGRNSRQSATIREQDLEIAMLKSALANQTVQAGRPDFSTMSDADLVTMLKEAAVRLLKQAESEST